MEMSEMKIKTNQSYSLKFYLHKKRKPIILTGLSKNDVDNFTTNASSKMFIKYGQVIIRTESIDYVVINKKVS